MMKSSVIAAALPRMLTLTGRTLIVFTISYRGEAFALDEEKDKFVGRVRFQRAQRGSESSPSREFDTKEGRFERILGRKSPVR